MIHMLLFSENMLSRGRATSSKDIEMAAYTPINCRKELHNAELVGYRERMIHPETQLPMLYSKLCICTLIAPVLGSAAVLNASMACSKPKRCVTSFLVSIKPALTNRMALGQVLQ